MTKDEVIETIQVWINKADDEFDREEQGRVAGLKMALSEIKKIQPCEDCISRESVIEWLKDKDIIKTKSQEENARRELAELPPVTPQSKIGHWTAQDIHNCHTDFKCSECGYMHNFMHLYGEPTADYTYCPRCGAKMEVDE